MTKHIALLMPFLIAGCAASPPPRYYPSPEELATTPRTPYYPGRVHYSPPVRTSTTPAPTRPVNRQKTPEQIADDRAAAMYNWCSMLVDRAQKSTGTTALDSLADQCLEGYREIKRKRAAGY
jgi:hypothetical protein